MLLYITVSLFSKSYLQKKIFEIFKILYSILETYSFFFFSFFFSQKLTFPYNVRTMERYIYL